MSETVSVGRQGRSGAPSGAAGERAAPIAAGLPAHDHAAEDAEPAAEAAFAIGGAEWIVRVEPMDAPLSDRPKSESAAESAAGSTAAPTARLLGTLDGDAFAIDAPHDLAAALTAGALDGWERLAAADPALAAVVFEAATLEAIEPLEAEFGAAVRLLALHPVLEAGRHAPRADDAPVWVADLTLERRAPAGRRLWSARLAAPASLWARWAQPSAPAPDANRAPVDTPIARGRVAVRLGETRVAKAALTDLEPGDVVLFDRKPPAGAAAILVVDERLAAPAEWIDADRLRLIAPLAPAETDEFRAFLASKPETAAQETQRETEREAEREAHDEDFEALFAAAPSDVERWSIRLLFEIAAEDLAPTTGGLAGAGAVLPLARRGAGYRIAIFADGVLVAAGAPFERDNRRGVEVQTLYGA